MKLIFDNLARRCAKITTNTYSTSFSLGIRFLSKDMHIPIYNIYGFVRFADEIVDSFEGFDKAILLEEFKVDTYKALDRKISTNPILNAFQETINEYKIDRELIDCFLRSMEMDLHKQDYTQELYQEYILGSAEVVGLMCLKVFLKGDETEYQKLKPQAMRLGAAFQKVNFLRDLKADFEGLGRTYFPNLETAAVFDENSKTKIAQEIQEDFNEAYKGIQQLPKKARFGVYVAYIYYLKLFNKIKSTPSGQILEKRIRISNERKYALFVSSYLKHFNLI